MTSGLPDVANASRSSCRRGLMTARDLRRLAGRLGVALVVVAGTAVADVGGASALPDDQFGVFPTWETAGSSGAFTATATFAPSAGFPTVNLTTNSTTIRAPSGETAWLGDSTAFGQDFGSSRSQPYLNISTAAGVTNSTTTITFGGPQPAGWGFALGDVDADWVFIQAWQDEARTIPLTLEQLGFQGAENYCNNTPRPNTCSIQPFTDAPVWVTAPETFDGVDYVPGTLRGNSLPGSPAPTLDTSGAYGWFKPTVPVLAMDLLFGPRAGFPVYQLWLASPAPKATITGTVQLADEPPGTPIPDGTTATLNSNDGTPVLNIENEPVTTPVAPNGTYTFETEQRDSYEIVVTPPAGYVPPDPVLVEANTAEVTVEPITFAAEPPPPTTAPPTTAPPTTAAPTTAAPTTAAPTTAAPTTGPGTVVPPPPTGILPATGFDASFLVVTGAFVVTVGLAITRVRRRAPS